MLANLNLPLTGSGFRMKPSLGWEGGISAVGRNVGAGMVVIFLGYWEPATKQELPKPRSFTHFDPPRGDGIRYQALWEKNPPLLLDVSGWVIFHNFRN